MNIDKVGLTAQKYDLKVKSNSDNDIKDKVDIKTGKSDDFLANMGKLRHQAAINKQGEIKTDGVFKSGFVRDFLDGKQVDDKLMELAEKYPELTTVVTRPYATSGYDGKVMSLRGPAPLRYLRIGHKNEDNDKKTGVLLLASPHAREMMQPMVMLETAEQLLANYNPNSTDPKVKEITDLVNSVDIYVVPVTNPDGLSYAMHDDPMWRKTRCKIPGSSQQGVDTNRNYDYQWEAVSPEKNTYSGPTPFSEPESRHVAGIVDEHPNIKFVCDFHSRGNEIRRPSDIKNEKDLEYYKDIQERMQGSIKSTRGKEYSMVESDVSNGASDDYFYFKKGIYALVVEDGTEFKPQLNEALGVVQECSEGAKELLRIAKEFGEKHNA